MRENLLTVKLLHICIKYVGQSRVTFGLLLLSCLGGRYATKQYGVSSSSLEKYKHSGDVIINQIDVTTIENIKIIENLDEVE